MMDILPTTAFPAIVTPLQTPLVSRSNNRGNRRRMNAQEEGIVETPEEETRQDSDSGQRVDTRRSSPSSSPIAVLRLRRTNLFPEEEGRPTKPITVTYSPSSDRDAVSSRSLASSMFLVSPLRPLPRQRVSAPTHARSNIGLKASLIDSAESVHQPLSPFEKAHMPKRSLSDIIVANEDIKESDSVDNLRIRPSPSLNHQQATEKKQRWLIPAEHPYKILWDVLTFFLSFANVYATHTSIRDRQFGNSWFMTFCEAWFVIDILLNFFTEYRSDSYALRDCRSVWARYLTTWFVVDILSLFPGEVVYVKPIIDQQNRRNFFIKNFFRTKAVVRVTRILRGRHFKMFGKVAKHSKHAGVGAARLLRLLIKYIPKYLLFFRNMKGVLAVRMLRQIHWFRKVWRNFIAPGLADGMEAGPGQHDAPMNLRKFRREYDDDDDGAPF